MTGLDLSEIIIAMLTKFSFIALIAILIVYGSDLGSWLLWILAAWFLAGFIITKSFELSFLFIFSLTINPARTAMMVVEALLALLSIALAKVRGGY